MEEPRNSRLYALLQAFFIAFYDQQTEPCMYKFNIYLQFPVWLGGLFNPEAYITATRQYVAQANSWSLEELQLDVTVMDSDKASSQDDGSFIVTGNDSFIY